MAWPPPLGVVLAGAVVELRPLDLGRDVEALFDALDDDDVWRHLPWHPEDAAAYGALLHRHVDAGVFPWVVRLRAAMAPLAAGAVVGISSYLDVSVRDARLEIGATAYRRAVWGTAVNPECKLLLLGYAFDELGVGRVQLKTDVRNVRSQQAIARLGAKYEATLGRYQRPRRRHAARHGAVLDHGRGLARGRSGASGAPRALSRSRPSSFVGQSRP